MKRGPLVDGIVFAMVGLVCAPCARALDQNAAVKLCREYLVGKDRTERQELLARLAGYKGEIEPVLQSLGKHTYQPVEPGYHGGEHFASAGFREKHPDDLLYFVVPKDYRPDRPTGLIVFLHGGGPTTSRHAPQATLRLPDDDTPPYGSRSGDMLSATGMITVGPSAPWNRRSYYRWCLRGADEYLADVILECKSRFNIDPNRVFLLGHSMGGFGAYHHALRQADRFAAIVVNSGSWSLGYWPVIRGTPLCIVQGIHDARSGVRWHYTDVEYGRWTDKILSRENLDHVYMEHDLNHGIGYGRDKIAAYFASARDLHRDPYYRHVTSASPEGFKEFCCSSVRHNRWLSLDETTKGELKYDELVSHSNGDFDSWRLEHRQSNRRGAMIDAVNHGDNTIAVATRNVARFTLWLHPRMVDISKRVVVRVDGKVRFDGRVRPSLATALESYERRRDWGMIYPIKIELGVAEAQTPSAENSDRQSNGSQARSEDPQQLSDKELLAASETVFPLGDNLVVRGYSNRRWIAQPATVAHAIVMIHGILRNPDNYYLPARRVLDRKSRFTAVALISVGFDDRASAPKHVQHLALFDSHWKHGGFGGLDPDDPNNSLSSFHAMDRILVDLTKTYPQLRKITLIGHSAGAQFVDRYSVLSPIAAKVPGVALDFVALAPSSVLYPSELRPEVDGKESLSFSIPSGAPGYNEYPYGFSALPLLERLVGNPVADRAKLIDRLLHRNIVFAVGSEDTTAKYLDQSRSAKTQGPNRYTRLKYFVEFLKTKYHSTSIRLLPIAGVGHNSQKLIGSREMVEFFADR